MFLHKRECNVTAHQRRREISFLDAASAEGFDFFSRALPLWLSTEARRLALFV